jgi:hypothetical protein
MTPAQDAVLSTLGRCRTAALGGHLYCCDHCGAEHPAYNSCRSRHCPSCLGHKSAAWLEARAKIGFLAILHTWTQTLLHHPHLHCVVSV